jgi:hypothetical protein
MNGSGPVSAWRSCGARAGTDRPPGRQSAARHGQWSAALAPAVNADHRSGACTSVTSITTPHMATRQPPKTVQFHVIHAVSTPAHKSPKQSPAAQRPECRCDRPTPRPLPDVWGRGAGSSGWDSSWRECRQQGPPPAGYSRLASSCWSLRERRAISPSASRQVVRDVVVAVHPPGSPYVPKRDVRLWLWIHKCRCTERMVRLRAGLEEVAGVYVRGGERITPDNVVSSQQCIARTVPCSAETARLVSSQRRISRRAVSYPHVPRRRRDGGGGR